MITAQIATDVLALLLPRPKISTADWASQNVLMSGDSKIKGHFRLDLFPHIREILSVFDDDTHEIITVQTAAQVGKTTLGQVALAKTAACNPHPMAWADADERSARRVLKRTWRLFEKTAGLSHLCPPKRSQSSDRIETSTFLIHGAWAGSAASAADYGAFVVVLNETDKMIQSTTDQEADFRYLMAERVKGYVGAKVLEFSTPTMKESSYIEQRRKQGDNRAWCVPCPHCNHFQTLITGDKHSKGGIKFSLLNGRLDPDKAEQTAYYQCEKCRKKIREHHRYKMMQSGLWVPEGCRVKAGKVVGTPLRSGRHASFGPIPTLVSLLPGISIGTVAREFVASETAPQRERVSRRRNFINSWEGKTYDPKPPTVQVHELVKRLQVEDEPLQLGPEWSQFVTCGTDTGRIGDDLVFYWWLSAWGRVNEPDSSQWGKRGQLVDYGVTYSETAFRDIIEGWGKDGIPHADGGGNLKVVRVGVDSGRGIDSNRVYEFCSGLNNVWPIKGSSTNFPGIVEAGFKKTTREQLPPRVLAARKKAGFGDLIIVNSQQTQEWRQDQASGLIKRDSPDWYSIPGVACEDSDMLNQLIADYPEEGKNGIKWSRSGANEFGDTWRYSFAMAEHFGRSNWDRSARFVSIDPGADRQQTASKRGRKKRIHPTGKAFVATQR